MRKLPYDCVCNESEQRKLEKWLTQVRREIKLMEAIIEGYVPKIKVMFRSKTEIAEIVSDAEVYKKDKFFYVLYLDDISVPEGAEEATIVLLDVKGKPLYKHKFSVRGWDHLDLSWGIGIDK
jgi:hypothetical protein